MATPTSSSARRRSASVPVARRDVETPLTPAQKREIVQKNLATVRALDVVSKDALERISKLRF